MERFADHFGVPVPRAPQRPLTPPVPELRSLFFTFHDSHARQRTTRVGHQAAGEPLLSAIGAALYRKAQAEAELRRLVAYGREFTRPRPYKLADLATASGMSVSGVRTAYGHNDVDAVAQAIGRKPREWRAAAADDPPETGAEA
ncbi:hypothetical protein [Streptomyces venezuelae]|uniref:hypothetical protein n=1 Tax=Streptomyces venezuelae TaxID=54571 RepID=UPI00342C9A11